MVVQRKSLSHWIVKVKKELRETDLIPCPVIAPTEGNRARVQRVCYGGHCCQELAEVETKLTPIAIDFWRFEEEELLGIYQDLYRIKTRLCKCLD